MVYYAVRYDKRIQMADIIWGPHPDGSYDLNLRNLLLFAADNDKGVLYKLDDKGNSYLSTDPFYCYDEDDLIIAEAQTFEKLLKKIDKKISKRLVWIDGCCVGIRG